MWRERLCKPLLEGQRPWKVRCAQEDLIPDNAQQGGQEQTGSDAKARGKGKSHGRTRSLAVNHGRSGDIRATAGSNERLFQQSLTSGDARLKPCA
jgi:hypothetical protein